MGSRKTIFTAVVNVVMLEITRLFREPADPKLEPATPFPSLPTSPKEPAEF